MKSGRAHTAGENGEKVETKQNSANKVAITSVFGPP
jgi:hypothetical protein